MEGRAHAVDGDVAAEAHGETARFQDGPGHAALRSLARHTVPAERWKHGADDTGSSLERAPCGWIPDSLRKCVGLGDDG